MSDRKIDILTVNYKSLAFLFVLIFALKKLSFFKNKIIVCDNGSNIFSRVVIKIYSLLSSNKNITFYFRKQSSSGSLGHGEALNFLSRKIESDFGAIFDIDCIPLIKNWDKILIDNLNDNVKIIGTQATFPKKQDFPYVFGMIFDSVAFKKDEIDFLPGDVTKFSDTQDTGYRMRDIFLANHFDSFVLKGATKEKNNPFYRIPSSEYLFKETIVMSHFGRGSNPMGKNMLSLFKIKLIEKLLRYPSWLFYKALWISKVLKIIKNESRK